MRLCFAAVGVVSALVLGAVAMAQAPKLNDADRKLARDVFQELIETNTSHSVGSTGVAAEKMRQRLLAAGFPAADMVIAGPDERHNNLVVRYRGKAGKRPLLLIGHLDVVEAKREDWTTDPYKLVEKDGFFYGRATQDMKDADAAFVLSFLWMKRDGFVPDRDIILALTADEEGGSLNGVKWLVQNRRELIDAGVVINGDSGGLDTVAGKPVYMGVEATEKLYADFKLTATNRGGHSSEPRKDNAIYELAAALGKVAAYQFPFELNEVTRPYFAALANLKTGQEAADMRAIIATPPDMAAVARLSEDATYNATVRTACVATMLSGGHAVNALPQRAEANVNCRILPGHTPGEVRKALVAAIGDPGVVVTLAEGGGAHHGGENDMSMAPPPLNKEIFDTLKVVTNEMWPGTPIIPNMERGATDSTVTMMAGMPSYGFSGMGIDEGDFRAHGKDERLGVESFYAGVEFEYLYLKALTGRWVGPTLSR